MKNDLNVNFLVPMGLDPIIYPWGIKILVDEAAKNEGIQANIIEFNKSKALLDIFKKNKRMLAELYFALDRQTREVFIGHTINPFLLIGPIALAGRSFIDLCQANKLLSAKSSSIERFGESLDQLKTSLDQALGDYIYSLCSDKELPSIWMISVYDYTLFNCLYIATIIRFIDPESVIILGGDYFDEEFAYQTIEETDIIDAIVVGYGEVPLGKLIKELKEGKTVNDLHIKGLVTKSSERNKTHFHDFLEPNYPDNIDKHPKYVRIYGNNAIRMLTQRGCSWGECSFCTQLDRRNWRPVDQHTINQQFAQTLDDLIKNQGENQKVKIFFDSDENDLKAILPIIDICNTSKYKNVTFTLEFWMMVRKFDKALPIKLLNLSVNLSVRVMLNIESLNPETLKRMKKGTNPLLILQSFKAMLDANQVVMTNYFTSFPGEALEDVEEEVRYLKAALHLFHGQKTIISGFPYAPNARDDLNTGQTKYKITTVRNPKDIWLKMFFRLDLPFTIWAFDSSIVKRKISFFQHIFQRKSIAHSRYLKSKVAIRLFGKPKSKFKFIADHLDWHIYNAVNKIASIISKSNPFIEREKIFEKIEALKRRDGAVCQLYIDQDKLIKNVDFNKKSKHVAYNLSELDKKILRAYYWVNNFEDVIKQLNPFFCADQVQQSLTRLLEIGAIIRYRSSYLTIANDPQYWRDRGLIVENNCSIR